MESTAEQHIESTNNPLVTHQSTVLGVSVERTKTLHPKACTSFPDLPSSPRQVQWSVAPTPFRAAGA
jgi:hypothetical protein